MKKILSCVLVVLMLAALMAVSVGAIVGDDYKNYGEVYIDDVSSAGDNPLKNSFPVGVKAGNWFKLRVEMYKGTRDTVKFKVFVNDTLIGESDNFAGKHNATAEVKPLPKTVFFYSMGATRGEVYFDNVKLYTIN